MPAGSARIRFVLVILVGIALYFGGTAVQPDQALAASCDTGTTPCDGATGDIGSESCKEDSACLNSTADIGDNSCIGDFACEGASGVIGDNSCIGDYSCRGAQVSIGDDSCHGSGTCDSAEGTVGNGSCLGGDACYQMGVSDGAEGSASVGNGSCIGASVCREIGYAEGLPGSAAIGDNSCLGEGACEYAGYGEVGYSPGSAEIGDGSCIGYYACYTYYGVFNVGDGSCLNDYACYYAGETGRFVAGDKSCVGYEACAYAGEDQEAVIGNGSCNGYEACYAAGYEYNPVDIGNVACNGEYACYYLGYYAGGPVEVGEGACNGIEACYEGEVDVERCESNDVPPGCNVEVTKSANPTSIPETGDTPVTYTVRIEFLEDEELNWIEDDQFAALNVATHCRVNGGAMPALPSLFIIEDVIVCTYTYEPPPGQAGDTHDNVVTVNVGHPACPDEEEEEPGPGSVGPADHECDQQVGDAAIFPGDVPGTNDVTAEASVLYLEVVEPSPEPTPRQRQERNVPNIGAGLSGLFNGMPTPLPTAPSAVAPAVSPVIRPPSTGDGGVADDGGIIDRGFVIGAAAVLAFTGIAIARRRKA